MNVHELTASEANRRRRIVYAIREVANFVEAAFRGGIDAGDDIPRGMVNEIQQHNAEVLSMFIEGDEPVAWWTQVELYSGLADPLSRKAQGELLFDTNGQPLYAAIRSQMLDGWADGSSLGPRFRGQDEDAPENVDVAREAFVRPYSEAPPDMVWAPLLHWSNRR